MPENHMLNFEELVLPHLDAAYNLARWLTRNTQDAEDVVQEACLRAFRFFDGFRGGNARTWLLTIVRNTCYTWLEKTDHTTRPLHSTNKCTPTLLKARTPKHCFYGKLMLSLYSKP